MEQSKLTQSLLLDELSDEIKALRCDFDNQVNWYTGQSDYEQRLERDATAMRNQISSLQQQLLSSRQQHSFVEQNYTSLHGDFINLQAQNRNLMSQIQDLKRQPRR